MFCSPSCNTVAAPSAYVQISVEAAHAQEAAAPHENVRERRRTLTTGVEAFAGDAPGQTLSAALFGAGVDFSLARPGFEPPAQQQPFLTGGLALASGVWTVVSRTCFMAISFDTSGSWVGAHKR